MMAAYMDKDQEETALLLYTKMQKGGVKPEQVTFVIAFQACGYLAEKYGATLPNGSVSRKMFEVPSFCLLPEELGIATNMADAGLSYLLHTSSVSTFSTWCYAKILRLVEREFQRGLRRIFWFWERQPHLVLGETATKQKDKWARKKFDFWRKVSGVDCDTLLEKIELCELNVMLSKFFLVVCKQGGALFPSDTLMGLFRCFGRIIKNEQDLRIAATVHGGLELRKLERTMFCRGSDELGQYVRDCARCRCPICSPRTQVWYNKNWLLPSYAYELGGESHVGDDFPIEEDLPNDLPAESARALGVGGRHIARDATFVFPVYNMSNCVVNVDGSSSGYFYMCLLHSCLADFMPCADVSEGAEIVSDGWDQDHLPRSKRKDDASVHTHMQEEHMAVDLQAII
ncbi:hypothetical protein GOP47_0011147 [Adiantum capillus-veneris]|uniref:Pentatricopeptide repeat-containing protein n=1 Tax=Adiantum capillus-veneris TaxID=13818 RepID=A0A9D4ZF49_ADICA|nr:hypothetical protein GOP47_0011147 [Adiantum capillus-veneris]